MNLADIKQKVRNWDAHLKTSPVTPKDVCELIDEVDRLQEECRRLGNIIVNKEAELLQAQMMDGIGQRKL